MRTVKFGKLSLPRLGFGSRRLPLNEDGTINSSVVEAMVDYAMEKGLNYFNTGYNYHRMKSEGVISKALSKYPRESYFLADSYPGYQSDDGRNPKDIFEEQLEKCGAGYFDFYRLQNVYGKYFEAYSDLNLGIVDYFVKQKEKGRIRHLGFSTYGSPNIISKFLNQFGSVMEFAQIGMNYIDWTLRHVNRKYELLTARNIPIFVIEPMHGGRLTHLPAEDEAVLSFCVPNRTPREISYRWLESFPNVKMIISTMSSFNQLQQDVSLFEKFEKKDRLSHAEIKSVEKFAEHLIKGISCDDCGVCTENCPYSLDIPSIIHLYNDIRFSSLNKAVASAIMLHDRFPGKNLHRCLGCGVCNLLCSRKTDIPKVIFEVREMLDHYPELEDILKVRNGNKDNRTEE